MKPLNVSKVLKMSAIEDKVGELRKLNIEADTSVAAMQSFRKGLDGAACSNAASSSVAAQPQMMHKLSLLLSGGG